MVKLVDYCTTHCTIHYVFHIPNIPFLFDCSKIRLFIVMRLCGVSYDVYHLTFPLNFPGGGQSPSGMFRPSTTPIRAGGTVPPTAGTLMRPYGTVRPRQYSEFIRASVT